MKNKKITHGDLVLAPFPFTDLSSNKIRPALVVGSSNEDITILCVSSQLKDGEFGVIVGPSKENGLKTQSQIIASKIATLDRKMIIGQVGALADQELFLVKDALKRFMCL